MGVRSIEECIFVDCRFRGKRGWVDKRYRVEYYFVDLKRGY